MIYVASGSGARSVTATEQPLISLASSAIPLSIHTLIYATSVRNFNIVYNSRIINNASGHMNNKNRCCTH